VTPPLGMEVPLKPLKATQATVALRRDCWRVESNPSENLLTHNIVYNTKIYCILFYNNNGLIVIITMDKLTMDNNGYNKGVL
jgi:hypothetical protein